MPPKNVTISRSIFDTINFLMYLAPSVCGNKGGAAAPTGGKGGGTSQQGAVGEGGAYGISAKHSKAEKRAARKAAKAEEKRRQAKPEKDSCGGTF